MPRLIGQYDDATYTLVVLRSLDEPFPPIADCRYFRLVVFLDNPQIRDDDSLTAFINSSLDAGARSVLCGGSAAERVHDAFDDVIVERGEVNKELYDPERGHFIVTTWHDDEPTDDILWQASGIGIGHDDFESEQPTIVVAVLAGDPRADEISQMSQDFPASMDAVVERA